MALLSISIDDIQDMCNNVLILYKAYGKKNQELSDLANLAYNLLWIYSKSLIVLKMLLNSSVRCEQDYALGQICVTVNEGIKAVIGFTPDKRNTSLWIDKMGKYILEQVELKSQYDKEQMFMACSQFCLCLFRKRVSTRKQ